MAQLLFIAILIILVTLCGETITRLFKTVKQKTNPLHKNKDFGEVIDISSAWIDTTNMPYHYRSSILSDRESVLYSSLTRILAGSGLAVYPKVRLADIIFPDPQANKLREYNKRIKDKSVDFLICRLPQNEPQCLILTEDNRNPTKKQPQDQFITRVGKSVGLAVITITPDTLPNDTELWSILKDNRIVF